MSQTDFHGFRHRAGCTYGACGEISRLPPEMTTSVYGFLETVVDLFRLLKPTVAVRLLRV